MPSFPGPKMLRNGLCDSEETFTTLFGPGCHGAAGAMRLVCNSKSPSRPINSCNSPASRTWSSFLLLEANAGADLETGAIGVSCTARLSKLRVGNGSGEFSDAIPMESSDPIQFGLNVLLAKVTVSPGAP